MSKTNAGSERHAVLTCADLVVPQTQQLQMLNMSNGDVAPGSVETQQLRIIAPPEAQIRLRLRISFTKGNEPVQDQVDFNSFPKTLAQGGTA